MDGLYQDIHDMIMMTKKADRIARFYELLEYWGVEEDLEEEE